MATMDTGTNGWQTNDSIKIVNVVPLTIHEEDIF